MNQPAVSTNRYPHYDVAVCGGGMAGIAAAIACRPPGRQHRLGREIRLARRHGHHRRDRPAQLLQHLRHPPRRGAPARCRRGRARAGRPLRSVWAERWATCAWSAAGTLSACSPRSNRRPSSWRRSSSAARPASSCSCTPSSTKSRAAKPPDRRPDRVEQGRAQPHHAPASTSTAPATATSPPGRALPGRDLPKPRSAAPIPPVSPSAWSTSISSAWKPTSKAAG